VRKNDERNPRHERDTGKKGSQNTGLSWVWSSIYDQLARSCAIILSGLARSKDSVEKEKTGENTSETLEVKIYDGGSDVDEYCRKPGLKIMTLLKKAVKAFRIGYKRSTAYSDVQEYQKTAAEAQDCDKNAGLNNDSELKPVDSNEKLLDSSVNQRNEVKIDQTLSVDCNANHKTNELESEEEKKLKTHSKLEKFMSQVDSDGFSRYDKLILEGNQPIPEAHGTYIVSPAERKKTTFVKYDPEKKVFIVDEDWMES
jgi:hypothetical protein